MSLGSSNMAGTALGAAFSFLLYASVIQAGDPKVEEYHSETTEAEVGQNITLPCIFNNISDLKIANVEWSKENTKVALYDPSFGLHLFWPNVTIETVNIKENELMGTYLHLPTVNEGDSGIYTCYAATFPYGHLRREIKLKIKDVLRVTCSEDREVDVRSGENVTIHCKASANAQHRWTKNKTLVSEGESLELWRVTDAQAGVYTLTVNTRNQSLHKEFIIRVLTATTSSWTDLSTVSSQSYVTEEGLTEPAERRSTTASTTGFSSHDTSVTWTMSVGTDATDDDPRPRNVTVSAGENISSFTHDASVTSAPATLTHTDPSHQLNSTTLSYSYTELRSTQETATDVAENKSTPHRPTVHPEDIFSNRTEELDTTRNFEQGYDATPANTATPGVDTKRSHLAVLIIVPVLVLIVVAGLLYRRHLIKQRMDLPPSFKPPPPPVKYIAARRNIPTQPFPTSRCNSVAYDGIIH